MSEELELRRGSEAEIAIATGAPGEVFIDTTNKRLVVQDGVTEGGFAAAKLAEVLQLIGGALSGPVTLNGADPSLSLNKAASGGANSFTGKTGGLSRWTVALGDGESESGANAGSNFLLTAFDDTGAFLANYIVVNRATGVVAVPALALPVEFLTPATAPAAPASGWAIYVDTADGRLKAKASTGTVVILGTP